MTTWNSISDVDGLTHTKQMLNLLCKHVHIFGMCNIEVMSEIWVMPGKLRQPLFKMLASLWKYEELYLTKVSKMPGWKRVQPYDVLEICQYPIPVNMTKGGMTFMVSSVFCFEKQSYLAIDWNQMTIMCTASGERTWMNQYPLSGDMLAKQIEPWHEISNNVVCATSKGPDQPAHTRSLIRAFASRLIMLWLLGYWTNTI